LRPAERKRGKGKRKLLHSIHVKEEGGEVSLIECGGRKRLREFAGKKGKEKEEEIGLSAIAHSKEKDRRPENRSSRGGRRKGEGLSFSKTGNQREKGRKKKEKLERQQIVMGSRRRRGKEGKKKEKEDRTRMCSDGERGGKEREEKTQRR